MDPGPEEREYIRVLVADPEILAREGLVVALGQVEGFVPRGCSFDPYELREITTAFSPDVSLVSVVPGWEQAVEFLCAMVRGGRVVGLASALDPVSGYRFMKAGAAGVIPRSAGIREVASAVRAVASGHAVVRFDLLRALLDQVSMDGRRRSGAGPERLTPRQLRILGAVGQGLTDAQIARALNLSRSLVRSEIRVILAKTGARNRREMVAFALRYGLIS